ncbi:MAG: ADP-glyceromanno-heptose 6-epimerase [Bacteroidales bacterium]
MIVITGAAGFIASCMIAKLNAEGRSDLVLVDDFSRIERKANYENKKYVALVDRNSFFSWLVKHFDQVDFVIHLGARTDTTEVNKEIFNELNLNYSQRMFVACSQYEIPLIYASSAATYGAGEYGYLDKEENIPLLKPLNLYGESKNDFDKWVLEGEEYPPFWAGFKFFNVYGPNEYHKGRMASVIMHAYNQILQSGEMQLFRSHRAQVKDGMQSRDFVYVKDVVEVLYYFVEHPQKDKSGIYNLGTGQARAFLHLVQATFKAMGKEEKIKYIDTPEDIRDKYQYFTQADMQKVRKAGYTKEFTSLEVGVKDYIQNYLMRGEYM